MTSNRPGVSGMAVFLPHLRVSLDRWCEWTGQPWDKVRAIVGDSFRVCAPEENVYTLAAGAVLQLIVNYDIDPREVGFLGFGTESSTDNSAGAVIVKGMVDKGLDALGKPRLARDCEVPEFKHACLGGVYALKSGLRYLAFDGHGRKAIVVSADIAEYERGSTGEQTQGAGAVAMLLESEPKLFVCDLARGGSSSDYRGADFRKPTSRYFAKDYAVNTSRLHDFPVFNGKYSTVCYVDEAMHAVKAMFARVDTPPLEWMQRVEAIFFHRPYEKLPFQTLASIYLWALAQDSQQEATLRGLCAKAEVDYDTVIAQLGASPRLFDLTQEHGVDIDPSADVNKLLAVVRKTPELNNFINAKMTLGVKQARALGNLYTAAMFGWMAAAFEDALARGVELGDRELLAIGYGSGDAAEAIPIAVAPTWKEAAAKIGFAHAVEGARDLEKAEYEQLHDTGLLSGEGVTPARGFVIDRVGTTNERNFQDIGIDYYRFVG